MGGSDVEVSATTMDHEVGQRMDHVVDHTMSVQSGMDHEVDHAMDHSLDQALDHTISVQIWMNHSVDHATDHNVDRRMDHTIKQAPSTSSSCSPVKQS